MIVHSMSDRLVIDAPAKVNLHLEIKGKRDDGYHEIETLMTAVTLFDSLTFCESAAGYELRCDDASVGNVEDNLISRAVKLIRAESGCQRGVVIDLVKRIPVAAGLAGGSSDAAATFVGLNRWWNLGWPESRLAELSARLGSDIPFFFQPSAAIARGRGERIDPCPLGQVLHLVVVCPNERLSTAEVYRHVTVGHSPVEINAIEAAARSADASALGRLLFNRLQTVSARLSPAVARIEAEAAGWDCLGHLMSGSGTAYFALCSSQAKAAELGQSVTAQNLGKVWVVQSCP